ncbi:MAG: isochorismatase family protein [Chitinophagaceae bacterium]
MKKTFYFIALLIIVLNCSFYTTNRRLPEANATGITVNLQSRVASPGDDKSFTIVSKKEQWDPKATAIIICDMWDQHWCKGATKRVGELAPHINDVIVAARKKGVLIVHAPSDCMSYYKDATGRKLMQQYAGTTPGYVTGDVKLASEKDVAWPIDQSNEGCDDSPRCEQRNAWTREISTIVIDPKDAISDDGEEIGKLFTDRKIKNVILVGVHTNMCIIHRSFGLRNMTRLGMNVALMRDLTDAMYDHTQWPYVSHFEGVDRMIAYIEKYICPTITSSDITGKSNFSFTKK